MLIHPLHNFESLSRFCSDIFGRAISDYHRFDSVDHVLVNPFPTQTLEHLLYRKSWIDTVQWHLEDLIRDPDIESSAALQIKRRIDKSNQDRTDLVERIDTYFAYLFENVVPDSEAYYNTESPAWAVDRLSILLLKIYHMNAEFLRAHDIEHKRRCEAKVKILIDQKLILQDAIDQLILNLRMGKVRMAVYRQMKMYNDPMLNPVLYEKP